MFLGSYEFSGDATSLLPAYRRLMEGFPPDSRLLHVCVSTDRGLVVYDACPSRDVFLGFSTSPDFAAAVARAGLPAPVVVVLGEVESAHLKEAV